MEPEESGQGRADVGGRVLDRDPALASRERAQRAGQDYHKRHQAARRRVRAVLLAALLAAFLGGTDRGRLTTRFTTAATAVTTAARTQTTGGSPCAISFHAFPSFRDAKTLPLRVPK
jgi:hypothetical protein